MAGYTTTPRPTQGHTEPIPSTTNSTASRPPQRLGASTRTLRMHVALRVGDDIASVHSTKREDEPRGVIVTLSGAFIWQSMHMLPVQARTLARALIDAAEAVELSQRRAHQARTRQRAGLELVSEGGAA